MKLKTGPHNQWISNKNVTIHDIKHIINNWHMNLSKKDTQNQTNQQHS